MRHLRAEHPVFFLLVKLRHVNKKSECLVGTYEAASTASCTSRRGCCTSSSTSSTSQTTKKSALYSSKISNLFPFTLCFYVIERSKFS